MTDVSTFENFVPKVLAFMARASASDLNDAETEFNDLALELFRLQREAVPIYREYCQKRITGTITEWRQIPAVPTRIFKDYEVSSLPSASRTHTFHSSGTTQHRPGRHFHSNESLSIYEASLLPWYRRHFTGPEGASAPSQSQLLVLTPSPEAAPNSSLAHMFGVVKNDFARSVFVGRISGDGVWTLDFDEAISTLRDAQKAGCPVAILGTAFSFVQLLDHCQTANLRFRLLLGSRALETGGYKGRTRALPKQELRQWIVRCLGLSPNYIVGEYGMSELSSQAYDRVAGEPSNGIFRFPPWARVQIISPETGREVPNGETGIVRVFDLANVRSALALQTEDLAIRREGGFELVGRVAEAEMRGCSLLQQEL